MNRPKLSISVGHYDTADNPLISPAVAVILPPGAEMRLAKAKMTDKKRYRAIFRPLESKKQGNRGKTVRKTRNPE